MTRTEQSRLIEELMPLQYKMTSKDKEAFFGLQQRHKDDEDLDAAAAEKLQRLHATYKPPKSKKDLEELWGKMTTGPKPS
ncbi:MAG: hypothetical protein MUE68_10030 [Bacteroidetes bacterium]|nr:hypothetical protein [Bacteroidota bacterium]